MKTVSRVTVMAAADRAPATRRAYQSTRRRDRRRCHRLVPFDVRERSAVIPSPSWRARPGLHRLLGSGRGFADRRCDMRQFLGHVNVAVRLPNAPSQRPSKQGKESFHNESQQMDAPRERCSHFVVASRHLVNGSTTAGPRQARGLKMDRCAILPRTHSPYPVVLAAARSSGSLSAAAVSLAITALTDSQDGTERYDRFDQCCGRAAEKPRPFDFNSESSPPTSPPSTSSRNTSTGCDLLPEPNRIPAHLR